MGHLVSVVSDYEGADSEKDVSQDPRPLSVMSTGTETNSLEMIQSIVNPTLGEHDLACFQQGEPDVPPVVCTVSYPSDL